MITKVRGVIAQDFLARARVRAGKVGIFIKTLRARAQRARVRANFFNRARFARAK